MLAVYYCPGYCKFHSYHSGYHNTYPYRNAYSTVHYLPSARPATLTTPRMPAPTPASCSGYHNLLPPPRHLLHRLLPPRHQRRLLLYHPGCRDACSCH